jgi:hypothetical protein
MADEDEKKKLLAGKQRLAEFRKKKEAEDAKKKAASTPVPTSSPPPQSDTTSSIPDKEGTKSEPSPAAESSLPSLTAVAQSSHQTTEKATDNKMPAQDVEQESKVEPTVEKVHPASGHKSSNNDTELECQALREQVRAWQRGHHVVGLLLDTISKERHAFCSTCSMHAPIRNVL